MMLLLIIIVINNNNNAMLLINLRLFEELNAFNAKQTDQSNKIKCLLLDIDQRLVRYLFCIIKIQCGGS